MTEETKDWRISQSVIQTVEYCCAIPEIGATITIPSRVSSIAILLRYQKFIRNVGPQARRGGKVFLHPATFGGPTVA